MDYRKFDATYIVRVDKGEELMAQLEVLARQEGILLAGVGGLGAVNDFTAGVYDTGRKEFCPNRFQGLYEIVSLQGTINTFHGSYYAHLHMSAADAQGRTVGGHLSRAVVSATAELVVTVLNGRVDRRYDEDTGLNLYEF